MAKERMTKNLKTRPRAIVLFSGGLDSILAAKILQEQKINVIAVHFVSPFFSNKKIKEYAEQLGLKPIIVDLVKEKLFSKYVRLLKKPKYGYGVAINPCIDCHIFMLKEAKKLMKELKADFIATGEVLDERPMSQNFQVLKLIEKEAGLKGKLLRPLSAKLLEETIMEKKRLVDRHFLLDIRGKSRKRQLELAKLFNLKYPTPAGGCILCEIEFAKRMRDLFKYKKKISVEDIELLKVGRHFRVNGTKIIVGRNNFENELIEKLAKNKCLLQTKNCVGPTTLIDGKVSKKNLQIAAALTARYSDGKDKALVLLKQNKLKRKINKYIKFHLISDKEIENFRI